MGLKHEPNIYESQYDCHSIDPQQQFKATTAYRAGIGAETGASNAGVAPELQMGDGRAFDRMGQRHYATRTNVVAGNAQSAMQCEE